MEKTIRKSPRWRPWALVLAATLAAAFTVVRPGPPDWKPLLGTLEWHRQTYRQEKVFLHMSQPFARPGERLWFSAYLLTSDWSLPSAISATLHVQVLDPEGELVLDTQWPARGGRAHGDLLLAEDWPTGAYQVRAYTQWMKNAAPELAFRQYVWLFGNDDLPQDAQIVIFPIVDSLEIKGRLYANEPRRWNLSMTSDRLEPDSLAVDESGFFTFRPGQRQAWSIEARGPEGQRLRAQAPPVDSVPRWIEAFEYPGFSLVNRAARPPDPARALLVMKNQRPVFWSSFSGQGQEAEASIPILEKNATPGILQVLLLDAENQIVDKDLAFQNPKVSEPVALEISDSLVRPGDSIGIRLRLLDTLSSVAYFSLAVHDQQIIPQMADASLPDYLWFGNDLGEPAAPDHFAMARERGARQQRHSPRYDWDALLDTAYQPEWPADLEGFSVQGHARKIFTWAPSPGLHLLLADLERGAYLKTSTDASGRFLFQGANFTDTSRVIVQIVDKNRFTTNEIVVSQADSFPWWPEAPALLGWPEPIRRRYLAHHERQNSDLRFYQPEAATHYIKDVNVQARPIFGTRIEDLSAQVIRVDEMPHNLVVDTDMRTFLQGRVPGLYFGDARAYIRQASGQMEAKIMLDGVFVDDSYLQHINLTHVRQIAIIKDPVDALIYGGSAMGGIIAIYTLTPVYNGPSRVAGLERIDLPGYNLATPFPARAAGAQMPDTRATIAWQPDLRTAADGTCSVRVRAGDAQTRYRVVVQGITDNGTPFRIQKHFNVRP